VFVFVHMHFANPRHVLMFNVSNDFKHIVFLIKSTTFWHEYIYCRCFVTGMSIVRNMETCVNNALSASQAGGNHSDVHVYDVLSSTDPLVALNNLSVPINCSSSNESFVPIDSVVEFWQ